MDGKRTVTSHMMSRRSLGRAAARGAVSGLAMGLGSNAAFAQVIDLTAEKNFVPRRFEAQHSARIRGTTLKYRAISEDTLIYGQKGVIGSIFSFSYLRGDVPNNNRPVLFAFNGGPGSSSVWLHLGAIGPMRLALSADVNTPVVPPFRVEANPDCLLDIADLVLIDPVGTGFSRIRGVGQPSDFFGVEADAAVMAQFINSWLTKHDRWGSPKYMLGESYGTIRASVMQRHLMGGPKYGGVLNAISLDGVALVGSVLRPMGKNDIRSFAEKVPNMAATAWYHGKVDRAGHSLAEFTATAENFAMGPYLQGFTVDGALKAETANELATQLSSFTGIGADVLLSRDLKLTGPDFSRMVLAPDGLDVGLYDSRYTLPHAGFPPEDPVGDDPAMARYTPVFAGAWHQYMTESLNIDIPEPYGMIVWNGVSGGVWNYDRPGISDDQSYAADLGAAMRRNPDMKLLVCDGYYDLATHYLAAENALRATGMPMDRTRFVRFGCGHMCYLGDAAPELLGELRTLVSDRDSPA